MPPDDPQTRQAFLEGLRMGLGRAERRGSSVPALAGASPAGIAVEDGQRSTAASDHDSHDFGFEERDTRVRSIAIVMVLAVIVIAGSIAGLFVYIGHVRQADASHPPMTAQELAPIVPPGPHLQDDPYRDIRHEREREAALLTTYGYTDAAHTRARIPLDRAITLVTGQPLDPGP